MSPSKPRTSPSFDTRHLLPSLPVKTSRDKVPEILSHGSTHLTALRHIIASTNITLHGEVSVEIVHRFHTPNQLGPNTLTLLLKSELDHKGERPDSWHTTITALCTYIENHKLTLTIEIIDHRILLGMYTHSILPSDPLTAYISECKQGIVEILDGCGAEWTSLEFWYRGHAGRRGSVGLRF
jgi:hypothetical protein